LVQQIQADFRQATLDRATRALLEYAARATADPTKMTAGDIDGLRTAGLSDEAIVDAVAIMGWFQFANFHADVLGIEVNPEYTAMRKVETIGTS
jgi:uncharacterized peroxidase-related enzyme